jgi:NADPH:quinone reductase-like Zn-dependent oxidoreductase
MQAVEANGFGLDALHLVERSTPQPGPGQILIRVKTATLNYRDLAILKGSYKPDLKPPFVPGSDACGEVVDASPGVTRFKIGDRVVPTYTQGWIDGLPTPEQRASRTLGVPLTGVSSGLRQIKPFSAAHHTSVHQRLDLRESLSKPCTLRSTG